MCRRSDVDIYHTQLRICTARKFFGLCARAVQRHISRGRVATHSIRETRTAEPRPERHGREQVEICRASWWQFVLDGRGAQHARGPTSNLHLVKTADSVRMIRQPSNLRCRRCDAAAAASTNRVIVFDEPRKPEAHTRLLASSMLFHATPSRGGVPGRSRGRATDDYRGRGAPRTASVIL